MADELRKAAKKSKEAASKAKAKAKVDAKVKDAAAEDAQAKMMAEVQCQARELAQANAREKEMRDGPRETVVKADVPTRDNLQKGGSLKMRDREDERQLKAAIAASLVDSRAAAASLEQGKQRPRNAVVGAEVEAETAEAKVKVVEVDATKQARAEESVERGKGEQARAEKARLVHKVAPRGSKVALQEEVVLEKVPAGKVAVRSKEEESEKAVEEAAQAAEAVKVGAAKAEATKAEAALLEMKAQDIELPPEATADSTAKAKLTAAAPALSLADVAVDANTPALISPHARNAKKGSKASKRLDPHAYLSDGSTCGSSTRISSLPELVSLPDSGVLRSIGDGDKSVEVRGVQESVIYPDGRCRRLAELAHGEHFVLAEKNSTIRMDERLVLHVSAPAVVFPSRGAVVAHHMERAVPHSLCSEFESRHALYSESWGDAFYSSTFHAQGGRAIAVGVAAYGYVAPRPARHRPPRSLSRPAASQAPPSVAQPPHMVQDALCGGQVTAEQSICARTSTSDVTPRQPAAITEGGGALLDGLNWPALPQMGGMAGGGRVKAEAARVEMEEQGTMAGDSAKAEAAARVEMEEQVTMAGDRTKADSKATPRFEPSFAAARNGRGGQGGGRGHPR